MLRIRYRNVKQNDKFLKIPESIRVVPMTKLYVYVRERNEKRYKILAAVLLSR